VARSDDNNVSIRWHSSDLFCMYSAWNFHCFQSYSAPAYRSSAPMGQED
jgi:hypothetical protein